MYMTHHSCRNGERPCVGGDGRRYNNIVCAAPPSVAPALLESEKNAAVTVAVMSNVRVNGFITVFYYYYYY